MKKMLGILAVVFVASFAFGLSNGSKAEAGSCYYTCSCEGTPLYCCVNNGVTTCKFTSKIKCLQVITC